MLGSAQRRALLAITKAYRTTSTDALQVIAGKLPLDLEIEWGVLDRKCRTGEITMDNRDLGREPLVEEWQGRWDRSDKGRWTYRIFPQVRFRLRIRPELDHFGVQFLSGHGDFNAKLKQLGLVPCGRCRCREGEETVDHVLYECRLLKEDRDRLRGSLGVAEEGWPCDPGEFVRTRANYSALVRFAKSVIGKKQEYTYSNRLRRLRID